jgi:hypothetical protein
MLSERSFYGAYSLDRVGVLGSGPSSSSSENAGVALHLNLNLEKPFHDLSLDRV